MPGGYDGYFDSLRWTAESTQNAPPSQSELAARMADHFGLTESAARSRLGFLKKVGFLGLDSGVWVLPEFIKLWLLDRDPAPLGRETSPKGAVHWRDAKGPQTTNDHRRPAPLGW